MALTSPSLFHTCSVTLKHSSNHDVNMERATSVISAEVNGFVLALFIVLGLGQNLTLENFELYLLVAFSTN